jgi:2-polyprenyl-3-methyl-5-hydroxy-6-metoxy-1,4-benzoquinol methylase
MSVPPKVEEQHLVDSLENVREDHLARYYKAFELIEGNILDAACGCGYGTHILSKSMNVQSITGIDISDKSLEYANKYWKQNCKKIIFDKCDLSSYNESTIYDWVVSFETIEHLKNPEVFLKQVNTKHIICSVPNQDIFKYNAARHIYHYRHYTPQEFVDLLKSCGFHINKLYYQEDKYSKEFNYNTGRTIIIEGSRIKTK